MRYLDATSIFTLIFGDKMNRESARVESGERCGGGALTLEEGNCAYCIVIIAIIIQPACEACGPEAPAR